MFYTQLKALFPLWQEWLISSQLQKIKQHSEMSFSLGFYSAKRGAFDFVFDFSQGKSFAFINSEASSLSGLPAQGFVMVLRKHLSGHRVVDVEQIPEDKVFRLIFKHQFSLVFELKGRYGNLFLCNENNELLASLRKDTSYRQLSIGMTYVAAQKPTGLSFQRTDPLNLQSVSEELRQGVFARWALAQYLLRSLSTQLQRLIAFQNQKLKRLNNRVTQAQSDFESLDQQTRYVQYVELLQGAYANPPHKGATSVSVVDYYATDFGSAEVPSQITIPLRPHLSLVENIAWYGRRAKKIERAAEYALQILPILESQSAELKEQLEVDRVSLVNIKAGRLPDSEVINEIKEREAVLNTLLQGETVSKKAPSFKNRAYRSFGEQGNLWVGKSAKDNHELTFKLSKGNDYWFHVQDSAGSHVVLRGVDELTNSQLEEASRLAAFYSPLRKSFERGETIAVSYTRVKYVKAIKGAKPGLVHLQQFKTYRVRMA